MPYGCHKLLHENSYFIETVVICCVYRRNYIVFQIQWNNLVSATVTCLKLLCKAFVQSSKITEYFNKARTKYCSPGFLFLVIINTGFSNIQDFPSRDVTRVVQIIIHQRIFEHASEILQGSLKNEPECLFVRAV